MTYKLVELNEMDFEKSSFGILSNPWGKIPIWPDDRPVYYVCSYNCTEKSQHFSDEYLDAFFLII